MENTEEIYHYLEDFSKRKPKVIPQELNDYLAYVARTGDPVYQWSLVKSLFKEKLLSVITDFYETTPTIEIPPYPNVDPFNYDAMKNSLLERLDSFASAPFTVQRICELLTYPRKQYNRVDKFMRAVEKNILVVSTREPGAQRHVEPENGEPTEPVVNGSDNNSEYNVDVEMEDMSWKDNAEQRNTEPQPSSSEIHISVDDIEARLQAKQADSALQGQEKTSAQYESVTPPELNTATDEQEMKTEDPIPVTNTLVDVTENETLPTEPTTNIPQINPQVEDPKVDVEMKPTEVEQEPDPLVIPEIKIEDAEMTEQRLAMQTDSIEEKPSECQAVTETVSQPEEKLVTEPEEKMEEAPQPIVSEDNSNENSNDSNIKDEPEAKTLSEVITSSEESSSSSDNTDGNSNSPKPEPQVDSHEESNSDSNSNQTDSSSEVETKAVPVEEKKPIGDVAEPSENQNLTTDDYSISDVKSELTQPPSEDINEVPEQKESDKEVIVPEVGKDETEKTETPEVSSEN